MAITKKEEDLILIALDVTDEALDYFAHIIRDCNVERRRPEHCGEFDNCKLCQLAQKFALEYRKVYPKKYKIDEDN